MIETAMLLHDVVQRALAAMSEGAVPDIVGEGDGLREILIDPQHAGEGAPDGGHFHCMGQARPVVIRDAVDEDLRFVFQSPERPAVDDPVTVALEIRAVGMWFSLVQPPLGFPASRGVRRQRFRFEFLSFFSRMDHGNHSMLFAR